ncbi:FkbM family methyltransferase [Brachyspira hyodysenteriae]|nr:FkbM family methyltransferase [Brachyspira hyodysenteriae]
MVLADYTDKKVYSFEPFKQHYEIMLKTINLNSNTNIIPVNMALGDKNKSLDIFSDGEIKGSHSLETTFSNENNSKNKIEMITLDQFVEEKNIEVGLIKTDLEGFEQPLLNGAINTIKKYKPVLLISIYHSYSDFFEIKPMIEALDLGYSFKILKIKEPSLIGETILIAEIE